MIQASQPGTMWKALYLPVSGEGRPALWTVGPPGEAEPEISNFWRWARPQGPGAEPWLSAWALPLCFLGFCRSWKVAPFSELRPPSADVGHVLSGAELRSNQPVPPVPTETA